MSKRVKFDLTPAQALMVNSALAMYEAEDHTDDKGFNWKVLERTRDAVLHAIWNSKPMETP